ncbi:hypothetical protein J4E85_000533 [Alternaria conjuncta]|uniref:uncharacterized protein n=1 Tax=Alternaria conjuncta TaxID=181017 RepID=UPI00221FAE31|nr:uncharacterized protein J4E85_000533 [Alternaria conjuncta]KAI4938094.1 hypothetical protein J4E85_000533 [Alternaria conjuncta]
MSDLYPTYEASFTLEMFRRVLKEHNDYEPELKLQLEQVEKKLNEVFKLPQTSAVRKTDIMNVIKALNSKFTEESIGHYLSQLARVDHQQGGFTGPFWRICYIGKPGTSKMDEKRRREAHEDIRWLFQEAHKAVEHFRESVSGWIVEEDLETLKHGLKCDERNKNRLQDILEEAWQSAERAKVALVGLDTMFQRMRKEAGCEDEDE